MPSKSAAQAKLMRAVAHNPAFAKKVGVPQSVGQEFMKADKRKGKVKKFELGGPTSYEESGSAGGSKVSFKEAFAAARANKEKNFKWFNPKKGKMETFTTELESEKKTPAPAAAAKPAAPKVEVAAPAAAPKSARETQAEADARPGSGAGFRRLAARFGTAGQREQMKALGYGDEDEDSDESPAMRRIRLAREVAETSSRGPRGRGSALKNMSTAERRMYEAGRGMKGGGGVKKYAGGGSVSSASKRADGIASRGKTRCKIV